MDKYRLKLKSFYIIIFVFIILFIINYKNINFKTNKKMESNYNNKFIIFTLKISFCKGGLLYYYNYCLGCMHQYLINGFIPIIDLASLPNVFNSYNASNSTNNPWEIFFNQPFGYTLENVKKYAKNIKYDYCSYNYKFNFPNSLIYQNFALMRFWHNFGKKYIPIKYTIIKEAIRKKKNYF